MITGHFAHLKQVNRLRCCWLVNASAYRPLAAFTGVRKHGMFMASVQAGSQNLNKEEAIPSPVFPLEVGPLPLGSLGERSSFPSGSARPPNAFGLSKTRQATSLVLLCDRVTCSITGHITRRHVATVLVLGQVVTAVHRPLVLRISYVLNAIFKMYQLATSSRL